MVTEVIQLHFCSYPLNLTIHLICIDFQFSGSFRVSETTQAN